MKLGLKSPASAFSKGGFILPPFSFRQTFHSKLLELFYICIVVRVTRLVELSTTYWVFVLHRAVFFKTTEVYQFWA
jgi:hypothetical protein